MRICSLKKESEKLRKYQRLEDYDLDAEIIQQQDEDTEKQFQSWLRFYRKVFNLEFEDATEIVIPPRLPGFSWLIVVPRYVDLRGVLEACKERFEVEVKFYSDIASAVVANTRSNKNRGYAVWIRHRQITDDRLLGLSVQELEDIGANTMTLLERLLAELKFYTETGRHLDQTKLTLCAGTRLEGDYFPTVAWMRRPGYMKIGNIGYTGAKHFIAAREVVDNPVTA